jgi:hypothetical protein
MMDETGGGGIARRERPVERLARQARLEMIGERPTDDLARESVEDDGEMRRRGVNLDSAARPFHILNSRTRGCYAA